MLELSQSVKQGSRGPRHRRQPRWVALGDRLVPASV